MMNDVRCTSGRTWMAAALAAVVLAAAGCSHRGVGGRSDEPAGQVARMVDRVFSKLDATDAQKERIDMIAVAALREVEPMWRAMRASRIEGIERLAAAQIDRAAIESFRAGRMDEMARASEVLTTAMVDIAQVLTPQQRATLRGTLIDRAQGRRHGSGWWR